MRKHIKILKDYWVLIIAGCLIVLFCWGKIAQTNHHEETKTPPIQQPSNPLPPIIETPPPAAVAPKPAAHKKTDLKSDHAPDIAKLEAYLIRTRSPLAPYASELAASEFWALLIGICHIEQYSCTRGPNYNLWGMMQPGGGLRAFKSFPEAISFMDAYFVRLYPKRSTLEALRGYYCQDSKYPGRVCPKWQPIVQKIKFDLEKSM